MTLATDPMELIQVYWSMGEAIPIRENLTPSSFNWLSEREIQRVEQLRFPKRRNEWLRGRWMAKQLLLRSDPQFAGLPPNRITIANQPEGAPHVFLEAIPVEGSLSISHREERVAVAWLPGDRAAVGVDIEWIEPRAPAFLEDFFSDMEKYSALAVPPNRQPMQITLLWSAKEAALKALRLGLRVDSRSVEIVSSNCEPADTWQELRFSSVMLKDHALLGRWIMSGAYILTQAVLLPVKESAPVEWIEVKL